MESDQSKNRKNKQIDSTEETKLMKVLTAQNGSIQYAATACTITQTAACVYTVCICVCVCAA